jgi:hypothetical protein
MIISAISPFTSTALLSPATGPLAGQELSSVNKTTVPVDTDGGHDVTVPGVSDTGEGLLNVLA